MGRDGLAGLLGLSGPADAATEAVETTMYRALAVLRVVVLVNALVLNVYRWDDLARPVVGGLAMAVMTGWTAFVVVAYDRPTWRRSPLLVADLVVTVALLLVSPLAKGPDATSTVPGFWVMGVVLAWGVHGHLVSGLIASLAVSMADVAVRSDLDQTNYGNIFLLMIGGPVLGYTSGLLKDMAAARDRAEREAAAAAERARLARAVHDGVLQVLALVQRRGHEIGGEAAELGRLAGEQESALRALVQQGSTTAVPPSTGAGADLAARLRPLGTGQVTVSVPATPVVLADGAVDELVAAVAACLDNVRRHAGAQAHAWVLLEDLGDQVVLTVRDDGPGIPAGRLDAAQAEGRLGVSQSIRGRLADLGGTAALVTAPGQGTEWELVLPRPR
ncbi:MAG: MacS family sensor histidine kinase [Actinomycetota bacterium]